MIAAHTDNKVNEPLLNTDLESQKLQSKESENSTSLGYILMILFVLSSSMAQTGAKVLFLNHASLNVDEMLFLRAAIFLLVLIAIMNKDFKRYMTVEQSMRFPLAVRCASGTLAFFCLTTAIKHLPIIMVSLF